MPSDPSTSNQPPTNSHQQPATNNQPPPSGYQPSLGRKLFMLGLCIAGLIFVWTYYYFATRPH